MKTLTNPFLELRKEHNMICCIKLKAYSQQELCNIYEVSPKTLQKWLIAFADKVGEPEGRIYTVKQVATIFNCLGMPYMINEK